MKAVLELSNGVMIEEVMVFSLTVVKNNRIYHQTTSAPDGESTEYYFDAQQKPLSVKVIYIDDRQPDKIITNVIKFFLYIPKDHPLRSKCGIVGYGTSTNEFVLSLTNKPILKGFVKGSRS
jgi:hypothetical protein